MYLYAFFTLCYYLFYTILSSHKKTIGYFPNSSSLVTKEYRIVNVVKASILGLFTPASTIILYQCFIPPYDPNIYILNIVGASYAALDMSAIIYNPYNHISTNVHHVLVQFLYAYCYYMDFNMNTLCKPIIVYAIFSTYSYMVNYRLSIRFLNLQYENNINFLSLFIYIICCFVNWIIQLYLLLMEVPESFIITKMIYMGLILMIINDDIFLMKFLSSINIVSQPVEAIS